MIQVMIWAIKIGIAGMMAILGYVMLPVILLLTPFPSKKLRYMDGIYGNRVDGTGASYGTDSAITMSGFTGWVGKMFPRYAWLQLRNPVNNLLREFGPS